LRQPPSSHDSQTARLAPVSLTRTWLPVNCSDVFSERRAVQRTPGSWQNTATLCSLRPAGKPLPFLLACFPRSVMAQDCSLHNPQDGVHVSITEGLGRYGPVCQTERPKGNSRGWWGLSGPIGFLGSAHGLALRVRMINCRTEAAWPSATGMLRVTVLFRGILWWRLKKSNAVWNSRRHRESRLTSARIPGFAPLAGY
jgi:hypothetical protein